MTLIAASTTQTSQGVSQAFSSRGEAANEEEWRENPHSQELLLLSGSWPSPLGLSAISAAVAARDG